MTDTNETDYGESVESSIPPIGLYEGPRDPETRERCGEGKVIYPNMDTYVGQFASNSRHGQGVYSFAPPPNEDEEEAEEELTEEGGAQPKVPMAIYEGMYQRGVRSGQGTLTYPDKTVYEGGFIDGLRHGDGRYTYANGDTYEGNWEKDQRHGQGRYTYAIDGVSISCNWDTGLLHGVGTVSTSHHTITNVQFSEGRMIKEGNQVVHFKHGKSREMPFVQVQAQVQQKEPDPSQEVAAAS